MSALPDALLVYALARVEEARGRLPRLLRRWREEGGRALAELFERPEEELRAHLFPPERALVARARAGLEEARSELALLAAEGIRTLCAFDEGYPHRLRESLSPLALPLLFLKGDAQILRRPGVAVVGARAATEPAKEYARRIAYRLACEGCNVISGLAVGVDEQAFDGAIGSGKMTIVLPQGLRDFMKDRPGAARRVEAGAVLALSQFLPDTPWGTKQAMARNATIYGLADAAVVVASRTDGGTWYGAREALRRGRRVFVRTPASADRSCPGNAGLIDLGATPISGDAEDAAAAVLLQVGPPCSD